MVKDGKILVLGATGQLGAYTAVHLKNIGYNVVAVGHRKADNGFFATKGIEFIGDFSLEKENDYKKLPSDINAVVHLAGVMPAHADSSPMPYVQSIVVGMVNLCEWLSTRTYCKRVIFNTTPSDVCSYFGTDVPVPNDAIRSFPKDGGDHAVYAIAKNAAVDILESYKYSHGISSCVFRHLTVYGYHPDSFFSLNGEQRILPWRKIIKDASEGKPIEVWGDPLSKKELLYIKDFVNVIELAVGSDVEGIYNISGYQSYTLEEQIDGIIKTFSPKNILTKKIYCPEKPGSPQNLLDSTKTYKDLNWHPKYTWDDACMDMKIEMESQPFALLWGKESDYVK